MLQVFSVIFPVFAIVLAGYLYAKRYPLDMAAANRLNLDIFTPALVFSVLGAEDFALYAYTDLALAGACIVIISGLLVWPISYFAGWSARTFIPPMMFNNSGNMGLPLALFAYGDSGLAAAMVLFLVSNTLHFTVGNALITGQWQLSRLIRLPVLLATLLGLLVSVLSITIPKPVYQTIDLLGQIAIPLMLFALGVRMTVASFADWRIGLVGAIACPASGLLVAIPALWLFDLSAMNTAILVLFAALPPAVLNFLLAERYQVEPQRVAAIVLMGNMLSIISIPATLYFIL